MFTVSGKIKHEGSYQLLMLRRNGMDKSWNGAVLRRWLVAAVLLCLCFVTGVGFAGADQFRAADGVFSIDLPKGWSLQPQAAPTVYVFKGSGIENIIIEYIAGEKDVNALLSHGLATVKASGLSNLRVQDLNETTINGHAGAWGYYTGVFTQNNVGLNAALGAISLSHGGLYFLSIINDDSKASMGSALEKSFWSIR
jgi:hypothetical protein